MEKAYAQLPKKIPGATLSYDTSGENVEIALTLPNGSELDPTASSVFPVTRNVTDPSSKPVISKNGENQNTWITSAPKSEYLDGMPDALSVVLVHTDGNSWIISSKN